MRRLLAITATVLLLASCGENAEVRPPDGPQPTDVDVRSSSDGYQVVVVDGIHCIEFRDAVKGEYSFYGISCDWDGRRE